MAAAQLPNCWRTSSCNASPATARQRRGRAGTLLMQRGKPALSRAQAHCSGPWGQPLPLRILPTSCHSSWKTWVPQPPALKALTRPRKCLILLASLDTALASEERIPTQPWPGGTCLHLLEAGGRPHQLELLLAGLAVSKAAYPVDGSMVPASPELVHSLAGSSLTIPWRPRRHRRLGRRPWLCAAACPMGQGRHCHLCTGP